jgi:aspartyl-tRNA(Asn)/glutamyl-tRNA(Gln) amidotransferase subunit A
MNDVCLLSASELATAIRAKDVSPVEATREVLDRIERLDPHLNAFCTRMDEEALEAARAAEEAVQRGDELGPLHGVPVSVKDNLYVKGSRTTFGSKLLEDQVTAEDCPLVERLREAGAILVGRTNLPEYGWKGVTDNRVFGITRNPWNLQLTPGGSSGGASAAVASGLGPIGIGTDGGGSLRIPASFCGLVGHKPSFGRVPTWPGVSVGHLRHLGGITRTVEDSALLLNVIAGPDERDATSLPASNVDYVSELARGLEGVRIAVSADLGYATLHPDVAEQFDAGANAFAETEATVERVEPGWSDPYESWKVFFYGAAASRLGRGLADHGELLDPGLQAAVEEAVQLTGLDCSDALIARDEFWQNVRTLFESFDLLVTPTLAVPPFPVGQENAESLTERPQGELQWTQFTYPFNLTGQPAVSVPCGWTDDGLPIGLQIIGPRFDDALVLRAARALEIARPWHDRWPTLPE